jgi:hypothetical protein
VALLTAIYVKFEFGVDYFRDYRNIKTKHELSRFYLRMGDVLMGRGEWEAAEDAYRSAQQVDPDDAAATTGIVKARVFKPPAGEKYYVPVIHRNMQSIRLALIERPEPCGAADAAGISVLCGHKGSVVFFAEDIFGQ